MRWTSVRTQEHARKWVFADTVELLLDHRQHDVDPYQLTLRYSGTTGVIYRTDDAEEVLDAAARFMTGFAQNYAGILASRV